MYVVDIDASKNQITIGAKHDLFCREFIVENINLISVSEIVVPQKAKIKIRYNDSGHTGTIYPYQPGQLRIGFDRPQRAVTPGQSAVFFDDERVLGGAIIKQRLN
jgi:tRNA-specific 2-thiouridylase